MKIIKTVMIVFSMIFIIRCSLSLPPAKNIVVADIFGDNMVLQRDMRVSVWGIAEPGGRVNVSLGESMVSRNVDGNGTWQVKLPKMHAGGPYVMTIRGSEVITFENVIIGEVWLCSGQSNMNMPPDQWGRVNNFKIEIQNADYPDIRLFQTNQAYALTPRTTVGSTAWLECSPENVSGFSALAYLFGKELYRELEVPIGLIHSSSGGTPVEAWTSREWLARFPEFTKVLDKLARCTPEEDDSVEKTFKNEMKKWRETVAFEDQGLKEKWYQLPVEQTNNWLQMNLPQAWENGGLPNFDGSVWFRKIVTLSADLILDFWTLNLGPTDDVDAVWVNGKFIGKYDSKNWPTMYKIPQNLLQTGENIIDVWVMDFGQKGGIWGLPEELSLTSKSGDLISLAGDWSYQVSTELNDFPEVPRDPRLKRRSTVLYNAMIHPLIPYSIRGAIWYQGESNVSRAYQYRYLFPNLIKNWRHDWGQGNFPFLYVQIANHLERQEQPGESRLAELREAQAMALKLPHTAMAVAIDNGDKKGIDIHPKNKQEIGRRLALLAMDHVYDIDTVSSGPQFSKMIIEGNRVRVFFDNTDGGLTTGDGAPVKGFAIAGENRKFEWAEAKIEKNTVVLWNEQIPSPVAARYAWADNPDCNLTNADQLPAAPFRTDDWPGITFGRK